MIYQTVIARSQGGEQVVFFWWIRNIECQKPNTPKDIYDMLPLWAPLSRYFALRRCCQKGNWKLQNYKYDGASHVCPPLKELGCQGPTFPRILQESFLS